MRAAIVPLLALGLGGCLDDFNLFTVQDDKDLGLELVAEINSNPADYPILPEAQYPDAYDHLYRIRGEILNSADIEYRDEFDWDMWIIEDDEVLNAFAAPGGYIWVYTGLIRYLDEEDDLAGVLGHEIAHSDLRHATEQLTKQYGIYTLIDIVFGDDQGTIADVAAGLASLEFSREDESQSDEYSVRYLCDTHYAADGAANFFEKIGSSGIPEFLSTHPDPENRVEEIRGLAEDLGCDTALYEDGQYDAFKASLP